MFFLTWVLVIYECWACENLLGFECHIHTYEISYDQKGLTVIYFLEEIPIHTFTEWYQGGVFTFYNASTCNTHAVTG